MPDTLIVHPGVIMSMSYTVRYRASLLEGWNQGVTESESAFMSSASKRSGELAGILVAVKAEMYRLDSRIETLTQQLQTAHVDKAVANKTAERLAELIAEVDAVRLQTESLYLDGAQCLTRSDPGANENDAFSPTRKKKRYLSHIALSVVFVPISAALAIGFWPTLQIYWLSALHAVQHFMAHA
jgi:hypothetical protein